MLLHILIVCKPMLWIFTHFPTRQHKKSMARVLQDIISSSNLLLILLWKPLQAVFTCLPTWLLLRKWETVQLRRGESFRTLCCSIDPVWAQYRLWSTQCLFHPPSLPRVEALSGNRGSPRLGRFVRSTSRFRCCFWYKTSAWKFEARALIAPADLLPAVHRVRDQSPRLVKGWKISRFWQELYDFVLFFLFFKCCIYRLEQTTCVCNVCS